jgi:DNA-binding NtrC family response regulator
MDGLSVFREIRKISPKIKAVLITGTLEIDGVKESLILLKKIYEILREEN